jgi:hypothetical protein
LLKERKKEAKENKTALTPRQFAWLSKERV